MSTISASTTSTTAFKITTDTTGALVFQTGASPTTALTLDTSQNATLVGNIRLNNGTADGAQLSLASSGYSDWNIDNYSGNFRWYYNATEYMRLDSSGNLGLGQTPPTGSAGYNAINVGSALLIGAPNAGLCQLTSNGSITDKYIVTGYASQYLQYLGAHKWFTAGSGTAGNAITYTQAMTLDANGNLGLGTSSPFNYSGWATITVSDTTGGEIDFATSGTKVTEFYGSTSSTYLGTVGAYDLKFGTNSTERARITSGGRFLIGTTTSTYPLYVNLASDTGDFFARFQNTNASSPYGLYMQYSAAAPNNSVNEFIYCGDSSALRMSVRSNGGIANYTANNSPLSDRRLKKNITPAGSYLEKICAIPVVTYLYNDQTDDLPNLGVIAQDVQAAAPELCNEEGWGTKAEDGTNYLGIWETDIQYALMKCIQELNAKVVALENK